MARKTSIINPFHAGMGGEKFCNFLSILLPNMSIILVIEELSGEMVMSLTIF